MFTLLPVAVTLSGVQLAVEILVVSQWAGPWFGRIHPTESFHSEHRPLAMQVHCN